MLCPASGEDVIDDGVHLVLGGEGGEDVGLEGADGMAGGGEAVVVGEADGDAATGEGFGGNALIDAAIEVVVAEEFGREGGVGALAVVDAKGLDAGRIGAKERDGAVVLVVQQSESSGRLTISSRSTSAISTAWPMSVRKPSLPRSSRLASAAMTPVALREVSSVNMPGWYSPE